MHVANLLEELLDYFSAVPLYFLLLVLSSMFFVLLDCPRVSFRSWCLSDLSSSNYISISLSDPIQNLVTFYRLKNFIFDIDKKYINVNYCIYHIRFKINDVFNITPFRKTELQMTESYYIQKQVL